MKRDIFKTIFNLAKKQPWLDEKIDELETLLYNDCNEENERSLLINLIDKFKYISQEEYIKHLTQICTEITQDKNLKDEETMIVAMAADSKSDSSQFMLYEARIILNRLRWTKFKDINIYSKTYKTYKKDNRYTKIVLIDEFIGSGSTAINRVDSIYKTFHEHNIYDIQIQIKVLAAMEKGIELIKKAGIDISSQIILKSGITQNYNTAESNHMIEMMMNLEKKLSERYEDNELPSLGYGKSESLYCRERGNTPNNVFPIFWWPQYKSGQERSTILTRAM